MRGHHPPLYALESKPERPMSVELDHDELLDALASGVLPEQLPDWDRAVTVLPVFQLCRALFSTSPADTTLKVVLLLALAKAEGRFTRERVRTLVPHLDSDKTDLLLTSLYKGGWLHLRASDNTYRLPPVAFFLLNLLVASDFAGQTPANMLVRAVETVAFGDRIDQESTGHLLAVLLAELETQAEHARRVLAEGTPRQLIRFSRQEVRDQILHVGQVISAIEERTEASSDHFARLVRIHEALQDILRAHEGLGRRLAELNLKRLETSEGGYSLAALGVRDLRAELEYAVGVPLEDLVRFHVDVALTAGPARFRYRGVPVDLRGSEPWMAITEPVAANLSDLELEGVDELVCIENQTPFESLLYEGLAETSMVLFTAGYLGTVQRDWVRKLLDAGICRVRHWGDLDPWGLDIYRDLRSFVLAQDPSVDVSPWRMGAGPLERPDTQKLTTEDWIALHRYLKREDAPLRETALAMKRLGRKLEQEALLDVQASGRSDAR